MASGRSAGTTGWYEPLRGPMVRTRALRRRPPAVDHGVALSADIAACASRTRSRTIFTAGLMSWTRPQDSPAHSGALAVGGAPVEIRIGVAAPAGKLGFPAILATPCGRAAGQGSPGS